MQKSMIVSVEEITAFAASATDWRFEDKGLTAEFVLADFDIAMKILNAVAEEARQMGHHPQMSNVYNKLVFTLCTRSAGDRVTLLDLELAKRISSVVKNLGS